MKSLAIIASLSFISAFGAHAGFAKSDLVLTCGLKTKQVFSVVISIYEDGNARANISKSPSQFHFQFDRKRVANESTTSFTDTNEDGFKLRLKLDEPIREDDGTAIADFSLSKEGKELYWAKNMTCTRKKVVK